MGEHTVSAISEAVGLRRESTMDAVQLPMWLARLHRAVPTGDQIRFTVTNSRELPVPLEALLDGAGFEIDNGNLVRLETLPDIVAPGMATLVCGLNPSPVAANTGVPFGRNGNRFWPAAIASGLTSYDRDPYHTLTDHRVGFTDLVKRTTPRADELTRSEFESGVARLERLLAWLRPTSLLMVGLGGWRAGHDRQATTGWQPECLGHTPVYLMPNTSGLNAHETAESLTEHLKSALAGPPQRRVDHSANS